MTSKGGPPKERTLALSSVVAPKLARRPNPNGEGGTKDEVLFSILFQAILLLLLLFKDLLDTLKSVMALYLGLQ